MDPSELLEKYGGRFSTELGLDLATLKKEALFQWLLAAVLMGARVSGKLALKTWKAFKKNGVLSIDAILEKRWKGIVEILDEGGYARYDFKTASKLLELSENLKNEYGGDLNCLHAKAMDSEDLEARLTSLAKGIGPVTARIFLREMRGIWEKATPPLSPLALDSAKKLGYVPKDADDQAGLKILSGLREDLPEFEACLVRHALSQKR